MGGGEAREAAEDEGGDGDAAGGASQLGERLRNHLGVGRVGAVAGGGGRRRRRGGGRHFPLPPSQGGDNFFF